MSIKQPPLRILVVLTAAACGALAGCSSSESTSSRGSIAATQSRSSGAHAATHHRGRRRHRSRHPERASSKLTLAASTASATVIQRQPAPGACRARGSAAYAQPDPSCTPGAVNPAVTQATIDRTICVSGWTATVRPPANVTEPEKRASMAAYGDTGSIRDYEYDHLVPLELGGAVNDPRNLWPEPGGSPNPKDGVENALRGMVCAGQMPLARAQRIIATSWVAWGGTHEQRSEANPPASPSSPTTTSTPAPVPSGSPSKPVSEVNCSDFPTHAAAQRWFDQHGGSPANDVAGLDHDHDGLACESLP